MGIPGGAPQGQARLGRYELLARLATGGMGEIFLARLEGAEGFEKLYVVKRILAHLADDARFRQMLVAEARIASKMSHPNICQVFELGETDGQLYIVMEYLEGISLLPMLRRFSKTQQQLDLGFVAGVIQQVTDAMNYAHDLKDRGGESLGIIHRDVTPSNIFLTESGVAKVLDFGIAKAKGASTQTQEGTVKGKYAYMAPEQLRGAAIDRRVDLFALGVVLYEMLALRRLFQRKTDYLTFRAVMEQPIPDIRRYRSDMPDALAEVLSRALDRDPGNRFETARQFGSAVLDAVGQIQRPWTQGELSDFVRHFFADEIGKRSQQVATVISRTSTGVNTRSTMPLLITPDEGSQTEDGEDDEFPSVETEVEGAPPWMPRPNLTPPPSNQFGPQPGTGEFSHSGTPPPFGLETTGSAPSLQPLRPGSPVGAPGPNAPPVMVMPQRSVIWPVVAILMVAIAGGALFLVWKQMQTDRPPSEIKITQETNGLDKGGSNDGSGTTQVMTPDKANPPDNTPDETDGSDGSGATDGSGTTTKPPPTGPGQLTGHKRPKTYDEAIVQHVAAIKACANEHPEALPKGEMNAKITIAAAGNTKAVTIVPDTVNASPLGACLRNVLLAVRWPSAGADVPITLPLTLKPRG